ncbi:hypothetical protein ACHAW6_003252 [Cyclotella cf. meneghiniana]
MRFNLRFCCWVLMTSQLSLCSSFLLSRRAIGSSCSCRDVGSRKNPPNSSLFERSGDDKNDESNNERPVNDLDIFGQPKSKQRRNIVDEGDIRGPDRIKSCIPYVLVMIDGDAFGKYIYERIPPLGTLDYVLLRPIVEGVQAAPFLGVVLFALFALGPRLTNQSREVRFNAQQAVFLDIAILFPTLIGEALVDAHLPRAFLEPAANFVWYTYVSAVVYCVSSNLRGKIPNQIPFISRAADTAIGPF